MFLLSIGVFIGMPLECLSLIGLLNLLLGDILPNLEYLVVVLPLGLLELQLRLLQLLPESGRRRVDLLHPLQVPHGLLILLQLQIHL